MRQQVRARPSLVMSASAPELFVYGEVGWEVKGGEFVKGLADMKGEAEVVVRVNSPGGNVFEGLVMANAMKQFKGKVIVQVDGLAGSIASIIALAGAEMRMADNAFFMIHEPFTFSGGTADSMRKIAEVLDKMTDNFVAEYDRKSGAGEEQVRAWMKAETWFTAAEALAAGFADGVDAPEEMAADFDLSIFDHAPKELMERMAASAAPTVRVVERALRDAGLSRTESRKLVASYRGVQDTRRDVESTEDMQETIALARTLAASFRSSLS